MTKELAVATEKRGKASIRNAQPGPYATWQIGRTRDVPASAGES